MAVACGIDAAFGGKAPANPFEIRTPIDKAAQQAAAIAAFDAMAFGPKAAAEMRAEGI